MRRCFFLLLGLGMILAACTSPTSTNSTAASYPTSHPYGTCTPERPAETIQAKATPTDIVTAETQITTGYFGYTHKKADGNRLVIGAGNLLELEPFDIPLPGPASWVVAVPWGAGSLWAVALDDGQVLGFEVNSQGWQPSEILPPNLEAGQPPLLWSNGESAGLVSAPPSEQSSCTHPVWLPESNLMVFVDSQGNLQILDAAGNPAGMLPLQALPDARILSDELGRLLLLSGPTSQYDHGVLGDALEASGYSLITDLLAKQQITIAMPDGLVIEGITPLWADLNGDGSREIIVTVSNAEQGAQILVVNEAGEQIAAGPAIGQGYRWRHQLAVAPFGPRGELELAAVLTPHLGGVVEFYQLRGDQLVIVAQLPGYTSHVIGTRNLDMAAAGDFDGDGMVELLLPRQDRSQLGAIRRTVAGAEVAWTLPLSGRLTTNIGAVTLEDGRIALGAGLENGVLRLWHP